MPQIEIKTVIEADIKVCFDLARNIDIHQESLKYSDEKAIAGKMSGLIELGEWVSWEAKHFGIVQHLTSKITEFEPPNYFVDEMVFGAFKSFRHEHIFKIENNQTLLIDKFYFESPYGVLGKLANVLFVKRYMEKLLKTRNKFLKVKAEEVKTPSL
jgi:ligand-binding SRPBCC domain-containing protein